MGVGIDSIEKDGGPTMYFKKMIGNKCYLSPIQVDDYMIYTQWVNDLDVASGMIFSAMVIGPESERDALIRLSESGQHFAIVDMETDELIGNCGFASMDHVNKVAEVGIFIGHQDYRSMGYGTEALRLLLDYAFNILNMHNIRLSVYDFNKPAIACYRKVGFKEIGRLRESKQIAGVKYDTLYMDLLAHEFESPYVERIVSQKIQLNQD